MLSDEEKAVLKTAKENYGLTSAEQKILVNLIEKRSKEIEHQKLKRENQRLELEANIEEYIKALTEWVNGERVSIHCVHKDKIKAKIEDILNSENGEAIEKLIEWKSLLEKE